MSQLIQLIGSVLLALIPAVIWGTIFYRKQAEDRRLALYTFLIGALAVFPILFYKLLWEYFPWLNAFRLAEVYNQDLIGFSNIAVIPLGVLISFMLVGLIEEVMKLLAVRSVDHYYIRTIDDSIEFFIIAALGFAFTENILYFYNIWTHYGLENLFLPFVLRSSFSTFAHLLFSGVLGYYYGTALFAKPILQNELRSKRRHWTRALHKIFNIRQEKLFHQERLLEGMIIAVGLHAIFNIFLELNWTFMIMPFLVCGYITLNYLFQKAENRKNYGKFISPIHFIKLPIRK